MDSLYYMQKLLDGDMSVYELVPEYVPHITYDDQYIRVISQREGLTVKSDTYMKQPDAFFGEINAQRNSFSATGKMGDIVKVAVLPTALYFDLHKKGLTEDDDFMKAFLNDYDNAKYRTNTLKV